MRRWIMAIGLAAVVVSAGSAAVLAAAENPP